MNEHLLLRETNELCEIVEQAEIGEGEARACAEAFLESGPGTQESKVFLRAFIGSFKQNQ